MVMSEIDCGHRNVAMPSTLPAWRGPDVHLPLAATLTVALPLPRPGRALLRTPSRGNHAVDTGPWRSFERDSGSDGIAAGTSDPVGMRRLRRYGRSRCSIEPPTGTTPCRFAQALRPPPYWTTPSKGRPEFPVISRPWHATLRRVNDWNISFRFSPKRF